MKDIAKLSVGVESRMEYNGGKRRAEDCTPYHLGCGAWYGRIGKSTLSFIGFLVLCAWLLALPARAQTASETLDLSKVVPRLEEAVRGEMAAWNITGISVALVDDQRTVYAAGFGEARKDSVFRAGSISKLFNALAVLQLVEQGKLDLDAPLGTYGADLLPVNPFTNATPVTPRELLCHRSGMIREAPVGGYFDGSEPSLSQTIDSIGQCVLVNPPNTKTRYSNVGPSIAGRVVERVTNTRYEQYQRERILGPLGMTNSAWLRKDLRKGQLVPAHMEIADGKGGFIRKPAPVFDLGTLPAGNLYTTAEDLARFISMLAAEGRAPGGRIVSAETLAKMFTPQLTQEPVGFGLAFMVGKLREYKTIGHSGAVYGHATAVLFLPSVKLGVVVLGNEDIANGRIGRLAQLAISLMLEAKFHVPVPAPPTPVVVSPDELTALAGDYESKSYWARLEVKNGALTACLSGQPARFTPVGPLRFLVNTKLECDTAATFERDPRVGIAGFKMGAQSYRRVPSETPAIPVAWKKYLGVYGPDFIPLVVSSHHGHLYAMTENLADYRLTPVNRNVFALPPGLYADEYLVFLTDRDGKPHDVNLANMILRRH